VKLAALGILHETNTFSSVPTDDSTFEHSTTTGGRGDKLGQEVWDFYADTGMTVAGYRDADALPGIDVVPIGFAQTGPFGTWPTATFDRIAGDQLRKLEADGPFDGVLMAQHGACVVEGYPDGDAEMIRRVREVVGPRVPIGNVMDTHGNVSPAQVHGADITLLWRTNPHLDCRQRGLQLAQLIAQTVRGDLHPVQAVVNPPMLANILAQNTGDEPMRGLLRQALEITDATPGLVDVSIGEGFPYADVPHMGMALVAVADRDVSIAQRAAETMARATWELREAFDPRGVSVEDAVRLERPADATGPILLLDVGDNMGAGTPGDSTFILEGLLRERRRNWLLTAVDPEAVAQCVSAGVGAHVDLVVGGKADRRHGTPQRVSGRVRLVTHGAYRAYDEKVHAGHKVFDGGMRAVVEVDGGGTIQLTELPVMTMTLDQHYTAGTDPRRYDLVVAKGVHSPQPAYNPIASRIVYVDTPGISTANPRFLGHEHRRRPMYPFEPDTRWP
jgi:microcystin degradation protein MlrC